MCVVPLWELNFGDHTEYDNVGFSKTLLQAERSVLACTSTQGRQLRCLLVIHSTFHVTNFLDGNIFTVYPPGREKCRLLSFFHLLSVAQLNRDIGAGSVSEHWRCLQDRINMHYCRALRNRNLFGHGGCVALLYCTYEGECRFLGTRGHFSSLPCFATGINAGGPYSANCRMAYHGGPGGVRACSRSSLSLDKEACLRNLDLFDPH